MYTYFYIFELTFIVLYQLAINKDVYFCTHILFAFGCICD